MKKEDQLAIQALGIAVSPKDRNSDCDSEPEKSLNIDASNVFIELLGENGKKNCDNGSGDEHHTTRNVPIKGLGLGLVLVPDKIQVLSASILGRSRTRADSDMQKRGRAGTDASATF